MLPYWQQYYGEIKLDELQEILQRIANYLQCPVACARSYKYNGFFFYAFLKGRPENSVQYASKGIANNLTVSGYDVCIEKDENGNDKCHSTDTCENVFILPLRAPGFIDTVYLPENVDPNKVNILDVEEPVEEPEVSVTTEIPTNEEIEEE